MVLRPKRLNISPAAPADEATGRVQARVVNIVFQGSLVRFDLETLDERELVVLMKSHERPSEIEPGDKAWVTWEPSAAYGLSMAGESP